MGNCCRLPIRFRRRSSAMNPKSVTLLLVGLDNSGKTTIAKRLAGEPVDTAVPTVGFSVISLREKGCHVSLYDLGGGPQIRDIWPRYYADAHGVVFVADAHDLERIDECRQVLESVLESELISGKPVLLLANKQDLDGALDEIDIVDRLNLERIVNEQRCPTLVELCSALHFSRKMDIGINNGYKWLIRSIIRDYPSLNNRVIRDLARQEEQNKVHDIRKQRERDKRREEDEAIRSFTEGNPFIDPFKPIKRILQEKTQANGVTKPGTGSNPSGKPMPTIPGFIDEVPEKLRERRRQIERVLGEEIVSIAETRGNSHNSESFLLDAFESDVQLLNDVANQRLKNFLVRPKSSGARLYGVRSDKVKAQRRKPLKRSNKTGPSPFTDISNDQNARLPSRNGKLFASSTLENQNSLTRTEEENGNPFVVTNGSKDDHKMAVSCTEMTYLKTRSKSMPNSRKNSLSNGNVTTRRNSFMFGKAGYDFRKPETLPPNRATNRKEILLDFWDVSPNRQSSKSFHSSHPDMGSGRAWWAWHRTGSKVSQ